MSATVTSFEAHRSLEPELEETASWLRIKDAAIDGLNLQIAIGLEAAAIDRRDGRTAAAAERETKVEQLRADLVRVRGWNPLSAIPRRDR